MSQVLTSGKHVSLLNEDTEHSLGGGEGSISSRARVQCAGMMMSDVKPPKVSLRPGPPRSLPLEHRKCV